MIDNQSNPPSSLSDWPHVEGASLKALFCHSSLKSFCHFPRLFKRLCLHLQLIPLSLAALLSGFSSFHHVTRYLSLFSGQICQSFLTSVNLLIGTWTRCLSLLVNAELMCLSGETWSCSTSTSIHILHTCLQSVLGEGSLLCLSSWGFFAIDLTR